MLTGRSGRQPEAAAGSWPSLPGDEYVAEAVHGLVSLVCKSAQAVGFARLLVAVDQLDARPYGTPGRCRAA